MAGQTKLSEESIISASEEQVSSTVADEEVILNLKNGSYYGLDPIGAHIWKLIQKPTSIEALVDQLLQEYEVDRETCLSDVLNLLHDMQEHELLNVHESERA